MAKKKKKKKSVKKSSPVKRLFKYGLITFLLGIVAFVIFIAMVSAGFFGPLPTDESLKNIRNNLATEVYSADGKLLGRYFLQQRTPTTFENISPYVIDALVATEDARFYSHNGVDYRSLVRVLLKTVILQDRSGGGGSTISQQLAKNLFPREHNGLLSIPVFKIKEILIARKFEDIYSKDEILTLYLNTVPFGENIYGIEMAANRFFSKPASDLKPEEAAVLIGMLKANHTYNPRLFPEKSLDRRNVVLAQMHKYDFITSGQLERYQGRPLEINYNKISESTGSGSYFREQLRLMAQQWCEENTKPDGSHYNLYTDGLKIYTTIDSRLQRYAEEAMTTQMQALQNVFDQHWGTSAPWDDNPDLLERAITSSATYKRLEAEGLDDREIKAEMMKKYPMRVFNWRKEEEKEMSPMDSIKHYLKILQTGIIAMDPETGEIKAWVGGVDFDFFKYDHVKQSTKRQVGSTFKPFVYAAALEKGIEPCKYISGKKTTYTNLANWSPNNADTTENEKKYSFEGALAHSVNTVTIKLLEDVGVNTTIRLAKDLGVQSELPSVPSVALGTADISLVEMATAYSAFANNGLKVEPNYLLKIEDHQGRVLYKHEMADRKKVLSHDNAMIMNHLLQSVVDNGTGSRLRWKYNLPNDLAGKTGTTQSNADGWFIGYNPKLVVAVWVGADNPAVRFRTTALGSGSNTALPIFAELFKRINEDKGLEYITNAKFKELPVTIQKRVNCETDKIDRNLLERILKTDLGPEEKVKKFDKIEEKEKEKEGLFKKIGKIFKKKDG